MEKMTTQRMSRLCADEWMLLKICTKVSRVEEAMWMAIQLLREKLNINSTHPILSSHSSQNSQNSQNSQKCEDSEDSEDSEDTFGGKEKEKSDGIYTE